MYGADENTDTAKLQLSFEITTDGGTSMKKAMIILAWLLLVPALFFSIGSLISVCFGYVFLVFNIVVFSLVLCGLSLCLAVLSYLNKEHSGFLTCISVVLTLLLLVCTAFCIFNYSHSAAYLGFAFSAICCFISARNILKKPSPKIAFLILSGLIAIPVAMYAMITLIVGFPGGKLTVVQTVQSPNGKYYAEVIDADQGALGGATHVYVYERGIDAGIFKTEKKPQEVYWGKWGEFENMKIQWDEDDCLMINSGKYEIKK